MGGEQKREAGGNSQRRRQEKRQKDQNIMPLLMHLKVVCTVKMSSLLEDRLRST